MKREIIQIFTAYLLKQKYSALKINTSFVKTAYLHLSFSSQDDFNSADLL